MIAQSGIKITTLLGNEMSVWVRRYTEERESGRRGFICTGLWGKRKDNGRPKPRKSKIKMNEEEWQHKKMSGVPFCLHVHYLRGQSACGTFFFLL